MSLKSIVRDLRDGIGSFSRRSFDWRRDRCSASASAASIDFCEGECEEEEQSRWASLPPELLRDVVKRVEGSESAWPERKHVVACAAVCRSWRHLCKEIVGMPETSAKLTFPISLKQPGPRNGPIQCYIKRNKASSTYHLYLGLNMEDGKFLLAARKIRRPACAEYIISMDVADISRNSISYMGKLRSNFLGTKFSIYDSQPPYFGAVTSTGRSSRRFYSRKVSPRVPSGSYGIAHVAYELNMLGSRGPRRMRCTMHSIPSSALEPDGIVPCYSDIPRSLEDSFSTVSVSHPLDHISGDIKSVESSRFSGSTRFTEVSIDVVGKEGPLILKNKTPRWHEQLQCWCLNFRGRVTIASVKNFQLIAASGEATDNAGAGTSHAGSSENDKIILQFGKIGKDLFTLDYRYPLSAFQAFGICLTSFDTKLACE
ncbi:tubby-like F-box protein 14 [Cinnamomum micranthum f. kanehirae]|uniref:Tubby-like F-box protein n=1 Tax=Cinnamomum micranthum f. kanehirae TaxID=337451 RepID=A0A3S3QTT3_9MAGN|nr:tubby-like F-box protein 14 [Cinnamomum micranthum f. kanehirae]